MPGLLAVEGDPVPRDALRGHGEPAEPGHRARASASVVQPPMDRVGPGLAAIAPSLRTGPVLVETDLAAEGQVRLPKVSVFGKDQNFLWRDTPASWRTDAILAATQTALLPDSPAELREGWIRVAPTPPEGSSS